LTLHLGSTPLDPASAHHARDVLRLRPGDAVELFDDAGGIGEGVIERCDATGLCVRVDHLRAAAESTFGWIIASALPKGARADWMIEKLGELGTRAFIPLRTRRSVVKAEGNNRLDRWRRIAQEAARQSGARGVMRIDEPLALDQAIAQAPAGSAWCLTLGPQAQSVRQALSLPLPPQLTLFVGPEGGWDPAELSAFTAAQIPQVKLASTILRVETAAIAIAALLAASQCL
jgi:16S rRNA (uracil1498-N3)-methyltransferase